MNVRCDDELVQLFVEGALEPVERAVMAEHIRLCAACRQRVLAYKSLLWDLRQEPEPEPLPAELSALSDSLMEAWAEATAPQRAGWGRLVTTFAVANPVVTAPAAGLLKAGGAVGRAGAAGLTGLARLLGRRVMGR